MIIDGQVWSDLRLFLEVARWKSFNKAAPALGSSHPTMLRAVRRLERTLGTKLVIASETGTELTKAGRTLAGKLKAPERAIAGAIRSVQGLGTPRE